MSDPSLCLLYMTQTEMRCQPEEQATQAGYPKHGPTSRCFNAPKHVCKALNPSSKCGPAAVTYWCKHKTFIIRDSESNRLYRSYFAQLVSDGESIVSVQLLDDDVLKITCLERNAFGSRAKVGIERLGGHSNISEQRKWQHTQPQPQRQQNSRSKRAIQYTGRHV